jgi:hypothetical protein
VTISDLYKQATLSDNEFRTYTGIELSEFKDLLTEFNVNIPKKLSKEKRLFAILYAQKNKLTDLEVGKLLEYVKPSSRDGRSFNQKAIPCLNHAKEKISQRRTETPLMPYLPLTTHVRLETSNFFIKQESNTFTPPVLVVDRAYIMQKIDHILEMVPLDKCSWNSFSLQRAYYGVTHDMLSDPQSSQKWKNYLYLRYCVLNYKAGKKEELNALLDFLKDDKQRTWLTGRLCDKAVTGENEQWGTSSHEWLERCLIIDVLKRSAGMVEGVESETDFGCIAADFDWLYLQAVIRSPTKYAFFKNDNNTIESGHPGAVKKNLSRRGFSSEGSPGFHQKLKDAFDESRTIEGFLKRIRNIFKLSLYSGKKKIKPSENNRYLCDGSKTTELSELSLFRHNKLYPDGYNKFKKILNDSIDFSTHYGDHVQEDISEVSSETTDESMKEIVERARAEENIYAL